MTLDANPCQLRTAAGELVARGFVREHRGDAMVVDAQTLAGTWFDEGEPAMVEVFDTDRGTMTYEGFVDFAAGKRVRLHRLRLQVVRQQRSALRVPADVPVRLEARLGGPEGEEEPDPPVWLTAIDLSAHGARLLSAEEVEPGQRWRVGLDAPRRPMSLTAEVIRVEKVRGGYSCGCRFVDATERDHDELFGWVLDLQRRLLARRSERR